MTKPAAAEAKVSTGGTTAPETTDFIPHIRAVSCRDVVRANRSNFFIAFRFLPQTKALALLRLYAFFRIADDCVDEVVGTKRQMAAIDFWRGQLDAAYSKGAAALHPVIQELKETLTRYQIPKGYVEGLLDGCLMDVSQFRYANFEELGGYCYRVAGLVGLSCMKIFEYESPTAEKTAVDLGLAFQLTNIIRDVRTDARLGRIYLPSDEMRRCGYSEAELIAGSDNERFRAVITRLAERAEGYYQAVEAEFMRDAQGKLAAARAMARIYHAILKKIRRLQFPVLKEKVSLSLIEKARLLIPLAFGR